jgi:hypothetical protein
MSDFDKSEDKQPGEYQPSTPPAEGTSPADKSGTPDDGEGGGKK